MPSPDAARASELPTLLKFKRHTAGRYVSEDGRFLISRRQYGRRAGFYLWHLMDDGLSVSEHLTLVAAKKAAGDRADVPTAHQSVPPLTDKDYALAKNDMPEKIADYDSESTAPHPDALQVVPMRRGGATSLSPERPEAEKATSVRGGRV